VCQALRLVTSALSLYAVTRLRALRRVTAYSTLKFAFRYKHYCLLSTFHRSNDMATECHAHSVTYFVFALLADRFSSIPYIQNPLTGPFTNHFWPQTPPIGSFYVFPQPYPRTVSGRGTSIETAFRRPVQRQIRRFFTEYTSVKLCQTRNNLSSSVISIQRLFSMRFYHVSRTVSMHRVGSYGDFDT
jgi:hypothetical protein